MLKALRPLAAFIEGFIDRIGALTAWIALVMIGLVLIAVVHATTPSRPRSMAPV